MTKGADAFRSIGEVANLLGVAPHVLRYWETQFPLLKPMKRPDGRRYYRPDDVRLAAGLCTVLRDEGLTIRGAKMLLARDRGASLRERGSLRLTDLPEPDETVQTGPRDEPMLHSGPKSRHRRRRINPAGMPAEDREPQSWLGRLVALNTRLGALGPNDPAALRGRQALAHLRDGLGPFC